MQPGSRASDHRIHVALVVLLQIVTCGIYGALWFYRRRPLFDARPGEAPPIGSNTVGIAFATAVVGLGLSSYSIGVEALQSAGAIAAGANPDRFASFENALSLAYSVSMIVMSFRARRCLEAYASRLGRPRRLSGAATFFLSIFYLQHKINELARDERDVGTGPDVAHVFE